MQRKLIFLACFFIHGALSAQEYSFVRFTNENGLSNNVVYATLQDSRGYLWVATHDGLNRYDGYEFRKFLHNPFNKKTLAGNMAIALAEDEQGRLWVLTNTDLHLYNPKDASFDRYPLPVGVINHSNQSASKMINGNNRFLLLNLFNGLFVFDKLVKRFIPITVDSKTSQLTDVFNLPFFKDRQGNILIGGGTAKGVFDFDSASISFKRTLPALYQNFKWQNETVTSMYLTKKNSFVYCTQQDSRFVLVTETGKKHFLFDRSITGLTVFIESLKEDDQGNIWFGTSLGIDILEAASGKFIHIAADKNKPGALSNENIYTLFRDSKDRIWDGHT